MDGYYKARVSVKPQLSRLDNAFDFIATTLWDNAEFWGIESPDDDNTALYSNIGRWALDIEKNLSADSFDLVAVFKDDNVTEFWYVDELGTIKKVFD